jgi:hypothetical protein
MSASLTLTSETQKTKHLIGRFNRTGLVTPRCLLGSSHLRNSNHEKELQLPACKSIRTTKGRGRLYDNVLDAIGDTPVIRVNNIPTHGATIYVKAEAFNPAGSIKDRLAVNIIEAAERSGALKPGQPWSKPPAAIPGSDWQWFAPKRAIHLS